MTRVLSSVLAAAVLAVILLPHDGAAQNRGAAPQEPVILPAPTPPSGDARSPRQPDTRKNTNRIVGGQLSKGQPFIAALLYEEKGQRFQYCGASVIADRWLLTAAHCDVRRGELAIINRPNLASVGGVTLRVERVENHPGYNFAKTGSHDNDIALLFMSGPISSAIPRVALATAPSAGTRVTAAGWGATAEGGKTVLQLRQVDVPVVDSAQCGKSYAGLTGNMFCAGEENKDSCQGDSGGPLFTSVGGGAQQHGVTSFGIGCGRRGFPGVYTRVEQYTDWIRKVMGQ